MFLHCARGFLNELPVNTLRDDPCEMKLLLVVFVLIGHYNESECVLENIKHWLFGDHGQHIVDSSLSKSGAKFEVVSTDEKFLKFASTLTDMSPLDACYHIVIC